MSEYTAEEKGIFRFKDRVGGLRVDVAADPLRVHRRFKAALKGESYADLWSKMDPGTDDMGEPVPVDEVAANDAADRLMGAIQYAFEVKPLARDGQSGLTDSEQLEVLFDFFEYLNGSDDPPGSSPTCSTTSPDSEADDDSPTLSIVG